MINHDRQKVGVMTHDCLSSMALVLDNSKACMFFYFLNCFDCIVIQCKLN